VHYFVGGATKLFGAALYRLRAEDFGELQRQDGVSPAWLPLRRACETRPEVIAVRRALEHDNVKLLTNAEAVALSTNPDGSAVAEVAVDRDGERETHSADLVVLSCGAANSAKLLLASANERAPEWARQRLGPGRRQLHVPQPPGGAGAVEGSEPHRLREDAEWPR
jgi:choline dehydrogenase-like flavoprotein